MDRAIVLHRVPERHPGVSREDAAEAWARCIACTPAIKVDPDRYITIGIDGRGSQIELVAVRKDGGLWLIIHAQYPPKHDIRSKLEFEEEAMNDRELCEMFGITLEEAEREVDKIEAGDYSDWDFSCAMMGSPMREEKMRMISAPVGESRIAAMQRVAKERGISRAEFVRQAIDHELLSAAP